MTFNAQIEILNKYLKLFVSVTRTCLDLISLPYKHSTVSTCPTFTLNMIIEFGWVFALSLKTVQ